MSNFPRQVRVIASDNYWGHGFTIGSIVEAEGPYDNEEGAIHAKDLSGTGQLLRSVDFEELDAPQAAALATPPVARVKYLYSVQDESGYPILNTRDREYAREFKTQMGGKKEGIIIMAYAPVKEIR